MPTIVYVQPDGSRREVEASSGTSVMKNAVLNDVPGIVAECGGSLMCATCHVYVEPTYLAGLPERSEAEDEMLDCAAGERLAESRLGCQIAVSDELDGITVRLPASQL
jgi:2Fe-2S ferredoxin